jgi:hypothetical protein
MIPLLTFNRELPKVRIRNVKARTLYQCNWCSGTGQHQYSNNLSSWFASTPGQLAGREARTPWEESTMIRLSGFYCRDRSSVPSMASESERPERSVRIKLVPQGVFVLKAR